MKIIKSIFKGLIVIIMMLFLMLAGYYFYKSYNSWSNLRLLGEKALVIEINGNIYRDLNKNGKLDIYENPTETISNRVEDLISQMTVEEKAGTMFITMTGIRPNGNPYEKPFFPMSFEDVMFNSILRPTSDMIVVKKMNSFNIIDSYQPEIMATYNNKIQLMSEKTRLGIPVTIATDPRHGSESNPGATIYTSSFSSWPSPLGLAATRDRALVKEFGDIARQEYRAIGITLGLHPMADLATEPRWARVGGTFGEDANLVSEMTKAYVLGFQGDSLNHQSVATMTKHFSGAGPQKNGEDAHFPYGTEQVYPGNNFNYHIIPFTEGAFPAKTAQIMPYYGVPIDQTNENVAFGFNSQIINDILRDSLGFDGVVCTDWNIISKGALGEPRAWGVENLTELQRVKKAIDAGCDQFGGENSPELIVELYKTGEISEERINQSVKRILRDKFKLGLFDNPYVDIKKSKQIVGNNDFRKKGEIAQAKSTILLKNNLLPLQKGMKIFIKGVQDISEYEKFGQVVEDFNDAEIVLLKINTPFDPRDDYFLEMFFRQGRLFYTEDEKNEIMGLIKQKPSVVIVNLERPAILTEISEEAGALLVEFGISDKVLSSLIFGELKPEGKLPIQLPSTWESILNQKEDMPFDLENPLFPFGFGLSY